MASPGQKSAALLRDLETSHSVPISPVTEDDKVARSSSHLIYFSADIFSSLQRTPGGETGARSSSHPIHIPSHVLPGLQRALGDETGARSSSHPIHFPLDIYSNPQRTPGSETGARSSSHLIRIADGRSEPVMPRYVTPYAGREFGRTGGLVVGSVS